MRVGMEGAQQDHRLQLNGAFDRVALGEAIRFEACDRGRPHLHAPILDEPVLHTGCAAMHEMA